MSQLDHAGDRVGDTRILNIPNALTAFRVLCVPLMAWLLFADDGERGSADDTKDFWVHGVVCLGVVVFILRRIAGGGLKFVSGAEPRDVAALGTVVKAEKFWLLLAEVEQLFL